MPRLRIFFDVEGWAYHWRALALKQYAPADYEVTISRWCDHDGDEPDLGDVQPDVIFCLPSTRLVRLRAALERHDWNSAVVGSWTTGWPLWISRFHEAYEHSDLLIVNHRDAWARTGRLPATVVVHNGVDHAVFRVTKEIVGRTPKVLWTGSVLHSAVKGYHSHVVPLMKALRKAGVQCEALRVDSFDDSKRTPAEMADWYNEGTVLVCASALEGTPNPCLEAAACGCTLVSTPVGNMPDLVRDGVNGYLVDRTVDALFEGVQKALSNYESLATQMQEDIRPWHYRPRAAEFYAAFDRALHRAAARSNIRARPDRPDLRKDLTVFVSTVGAPSYSACLRHLDLQDCLFNVEIIENVAPMSAAFQQMIDRCETPYYVQVDEDMLLYLHAVRHLHSWIRRAGANVAMCVGVLLDAHLRRTIYGVKIFRHDIVRHFSHADLEASESDHARRLSEAGFDTILAPLGDPDDYTGALGLHGTHWTPQSIYERYATLERKRRRSPDVRGWVADYPSIFLERYLHAKASLVDVANSEAPESARLRLERETELDLYALLGALSGSLARLDDERGEKDFRTQAATSGFEAGQRFVQAHATHYDSRPGLPDLGPTDPRASRS